MSPENLERLKFLKEAIEAIDFFISRRELVGGEQEKWLSLKTYFYKNAQQIRDYSLQDYELWGKLDDQRKIQNINKKDAKP